MKESMSESREPINEGLARLIAVQVDQIAAKVTQKGEWNDIDRAVVLRALATKGLKPNETLEEGILRGIDARVGTHVAEGKIYAADRQGLVKEIKEKRDLPDEAMQRRAA